MKGGGALDCFVLKQFGTEEDGEEGASCFSYTDILQ